MKYRCNKCDNSWSDECIQFRKHLSYCISMDFMSSDGINFLNRIIELTGCKFERGKI